MTLFTKTVLQVYAVLGLLACTQIGTTVVSAEVICSDSDCVIYDFASQSQCVEVVNDMPMRDCRWFAGMSAFPDQASKNGSIVAYQIQWVNSNWSGWFVPGVNDLDWRFNTDAAECSAPSAKLGLRRAWSYTCDHRSRYIICRSP